MKGVLFKVILIQCIIVLSAVKIIGKSDYDFFYFVQQWPEAYCNSRRCCFFKTGKPIEDFIIHGLWPNFNSGTYPKFCDSTKRFNKSEIADLIPRMQKNWPSLACPSGNGIKFWRHEWMKHGTCSLNVLNQHSYFQKSLEFKTASNLLQHLKNAGIKPDNSTLYSLNSIENAIKNGVGVTPYIECNHDNKGKEQLYQVFLCVSKRATGFIECPIMPNRPCSANVRFRSFSRLYLEDDASGEDEDEDVGVDNNNDGVKDEYVGVKDDVDRVENDNVSIENDNNIGVKDDIVVGVENDNIGIENDNIGVKDDVVGVENDNIDVSDDVGVKDEL